MQKAFWLKIVFLISLATVLILAVALVKNQLSPDAEAISQQTFFEQFVIAGGPIVWFVLLPMSLITVFLAVEYSLTIRRRKLLPEGTSGRIIRIIQQSDSGRLAETIADEDDFVSIAITEAVARGKGDWFRMRSCLTESLQDQACRLLRRIEWMNLIGNVSPMVGLFGTVFGMIKLFNTIVVAGGQPQAAQLAEGISVALVTTFWGLFIAIPALALHGVFRNRIETLISDAVTEADNIMPEIRRSLKKQLPTRTGQTKATIQELGSRGKPKTSGPVRL